MAYPQFGYPSAASSLASTQLLSMSAGTTPQTSVPTSCCETGRPIMTDPQTGQTICSCQYSSSLLSYPRVASLSETVYGSAYASQGYVPFGTDPSAFYSPLNPAYDLKDGNEAWRSLAHPTACYPYDPTGMAGGYPYGQRYDPYMCTALAQRKNATREATSTLKAWLQEHIKNPYPTKGEKIMLAIITKMTLTQVSTWFANARRRLKKENKMTWSPRNRSDEDGNKLDSDDEDGDGDKDANSNVDSKDRKDHLDKSKDDDSISDVDRDQDLNVCGDDPDDLSDLKVDVDDHDVVGSGSVLSDRLPKPVLPGLGSLHGNGTPPTLGQQSSCMNANNNNTTSKPRIWSIADVATSGNSPPGRAGGALSGSGSPATGGGVGGSGGGVAGGLGTTGPHLGSHLLGGGAAHHKLSPGADTDAYRPLINGFRPWVNGTSGVGLGSSVYPGSHHPHHATALSPVHGQSSSGGALPLSGGGGGAGGTNTSGMTPVGNGPLVPQPTSGLLRPYALTPRTEVH